MRIKIKYSTKKFVSAKIGKIFVFDGLNNALVFVKNEELNDSVVWKAEYLGEKDRAEGRLYVYFGKLFDDLERFWENYGKPPWYAPLDCPFGTSFVDKIRLIEIVYEKKSKNKKSLGV